MTRVVSTPWVVSTHPTVVPRRVATTRLLMGSGSDPAGDRVHPVPGADQHVGCGDEPQ